MDLVPIPGVQLDAYFPLEPGAKRPYGGEKGWFGHKPTRHLGPDDYEKYHALGAEWGLRMGTFSNTVALDADNQAAIELLRDLGLTSPCWAPTKRGAHYYRTVTDAQARQLPTKQGLWPKVDLISTGAMVRHYPLDHQIAAPAWSDKQFALVLDRINHQKSNGQGTWDGGDITPGARNETLNAYLYRIGMENPDLQLREFRALADNLRDHMQGDMPSKEFNDTVRSAWNGSREGRPPVEPDTWLRIMWGADLGKYVAKRPPKVPLLGPFLGGQVGIIYGAPGTGKTIFQQHIVNAATLGEQLGPWAGSGTPCRGVIFDGEMDSRDLWARLQLIEVNPALGYSISEQWIDGGLNLGRPEHQALVLELCAEVAFIGVDNISTCLAPLPDAQGEATSIWHPQVWLNTAPLRAAVRLANVHLQWVDHAKAGGKDIQGTIAKLRDVDYAIQLKRPRRDKDSQVDFLEFEAHWSKYRGLAAPGDIFVSEWDMAGGSLSGRVNMTARQKVQKYKALHPDWTQEQVADACGLKQPAVSKYW